MTMELTTNDYVYIGQQFPFNNFFLQVDTPNVNDSALTIEYWAGPTIGWKEAIDVLDATSVNGKTLARSGVVQFSPDFENSWNRSMQTKDTSSMPTGIESLKLYYMYWIRFKVSGDLSDDTAVKRFCYAFTRSPQLKERDVEVDSYLPSFGEDKVDWDDEIISASLDVVMELRRKGLIVNQGQIIRLDEVSLATDWKTLENIYNNCGESHKDRKADASGKVARLLNMKRFTFDTDENQNALMEPSKLTNRVSKLVR